MSSSRHSREALKLYKSIRRLHRRLPTALKFMGNSYVRDEFNRHKNADPSFIPGFLQAWTSYRDTLTQQLQDAQSSQVIGKKLGEQDLSALNDGQIGNSLCSNSHTVFTTNLCNYKYRSIICTTASLKRPKGQRSLNQIIRILPWGL